ncbi:MAG: ComF family protein [Verrucomicrobiota bacterium]
MTTTARDKISSWLESTLGLVFPETCQLCNNERAKARDGYVCDKCRSHVRFIRPPFCDRCGRPYPGDLTTSFVCSNCSGMELHFSFARSAVVAKSAVREAIHRFKYQHALWFEPFLADLLVRAAATELERGNWDYIVPIPLHPLKLREREFNQAERLATHLSRAVNIRMENNFLRRISPTATQTLLTRDQRAANMKNAFAVAPGTRLDGKRIILVDDVFTTGATTSAGARALRQAGAANVCVWTVARGL